MDMLQIDKEAFAYAVIRSTKFNIEGLTDEEIAKKKLTLYLSSYYLAERFNCLEKKDLRDGEEILDVLSQIKFTF